jgi:hypothetical protein
VEEFAPFAERTGMNLVRVLLLALLTLTVLPARVWAQSPASPDSVSNC